MRFTLPILSLFLLLLSGEALARSNVAARKNATLSAMIAKRQTNRNEIQLRAHVKDTVQRVARQMSVERELVVGSPVADRLPTRALAPRQNGQPSSNPIVGTPDRRRAEAAGTRSINRRQNGGTPSGAAIVGTPDRRRSRQVERAEEVLEKRSSYPKCKKTTPRTGYAHYPGWKLVGDELSGAIPVKPESACIQACNKYGGACSGVFFDSANDKCFLKGTKTSGWKFAEGHEEDGTDLIGGCSLWSNIVPEEMDAVCCRD